MPQTQETTRLLLALVCRPGEALAEGLLETLPQRLGDWAIEIVILIDETLAPAVAKSSGPERPLRWLRAPRALAFGNARKVVFAVALETGVDAVAVLDGSGRHDPAMLDRLVAALDHRPDAGLVIAARRRRLLARPLGWLHALVLDQPLADPHSAYRLYRRRLLERLPFDLNHPGGHFDTEILVQMQVAGEPIAEVSVPGFRESGGWRETWRRGVDALRALLAAKIQRLGIVYRRNLDFEPDGVEHYRPKLGYPSSHQMALDLTPQDARVLDLGCAEGHVGRAVREQRQARVTGLDAADLDAASLGLDGFIRHDLDGSELPVDFADFDTVLFLDVIEHLKRPEAFVAELHRRTAGHPELRIIVTSANVAFAPVRLMLLAGEMNYGKRGILDFTHTRLFTLTTLEQLFAQGGFVVERREGIPAPYPLVFGDGRLARLLLALNQLAIRLAPGLASYQGLLVLRPLPDAEWWLETRR